MIRSKMKIYRGIALLLALLGLVAIIASFMSDQSNHNYALAIGLALIATSNVITGIANKKKQ